MKKWWESPTAALGALCGEKAEAQMRKAMQSAAEAEYRRGYEDGKESAVVHAHWAVARCGDHYCSWCHEWAMEDSGDANGGEILTDYCPHCGAKMDEVQND